MGTIKKVRECIYPNSVNCLGCIWSYNPSLFDGGCKLHYEKKSIKRSMNDENEALRSCESQTRK